MKIENHHFHLFANMKIFGVTKSDDQQTLHGSATNPTHAAL